MSICLCIGLAKEFVWVSQQLYAKLEQTYWPNQYYLRLLLNWNDRVD